MKATQLVADWRPRPNRILSEDEKRNRKPKMACDCWQNPRLEQVTLPDPTPQPDEVVVQVKAWGVCGSDTHCIETDTEGYVVFSKIHDDVSAITVRIPEFGLRYNYRNEPVETVDLSFRFKRDIQKVKNFDEIAVK